MEDVTKKEGRTVLFVSHNINAIKNLCSNCILLKDGQIIKKGKTDEVVDYYLNNNHNNTAVTEYTQKKDRSVEITKISIFNKNFKPSLAIPVNENFFIEVEYEFYKPEKNLLLSVIFKSGDEDLLYSSESDKKLSANDYLPGRYITRIEVPAFVFNVGFFNFDVCFHSSLSDLERKNNTNIEIANINNPRSEFRHNYIIGVMGAVLDYNTTYLS